MMRGDATGKGLGIKGKSAMKAKLSGYVPFLQIHDNNNKKKTRWPPKDGILRIFYENAQLRDIAMKALNSTFAEMKGAWLQASEIVSSLPELAFGVTEKGNFAG